MFRTFTKAFLPNRFDQLLKKTKKKGGKRILLGWNRGLGDLPLGLYALIFRIQEIIPDAEITFVTRQSLCDGFALLEGVKVIVDPSWRRHEPYHIGKEIRESYDLVIEKPSPTDWVSWQIGKLTAKLKWDSKYDDLHERFHLPEHCIGIQPLTESGYAFWRDFPLSKWEEIWKKRKEKTFLLFGVSEGDPIQGENLIDLRGKTSLFELLSIIRHRVDTLILPDSGIASVVYYLNTPFKMKMITLWSDPRQGILKQAVSSPNPGLIHQPLIAPQGDLSRLSVEEILDAMKKKALPILLAGGAGTRLGLSSSKGLFRVAGKTLFQRFCEKLKKGSFLVVMTSPMNHEATVEYFKEQDHFGLEVSFFQQEVGPILDENFKETQEMSPLGNGNVFSSFVKAGLDQVWKKRGIEKVIVSYIDNPLSDPLDERLISTDEEVSIQCIARDKGETSMGAVTLQNGRLQVVEYTELDPSQEYPYSYSGQMAFEFDFFCEMGKKELDVHFVQKTVGGKKVWKKEQFIFDVLPFAKNASPVVVERKTCYAPIKDLQGALKAEEVFA